MLKRVANTPNLLRAGFTLGLNQTEIEANPLSNDVVREQKASQDLKLLSWPPGRPIPVKGAADAPYTYDGARGSPARVYVIDEGVNVDHDVGMRAPFDHMRLTELGF